MTPVIKKIVAIQRFIIAFCSISIAITFGFVVVLRYGFEANLFAYEEWMLVAAFILYFLGAAQGSYDDSHIKADLMNEWVESVSLRWKLGLFVLALEIAICAVLTYWGAIMVMEDLAKYPDLPSASVYKIPLAVPRGTIFIGFLLMTAYAVMHFIVRFKAGPESMAVEKPTGGSSQ